MSFVGTDGKTNLYTDPQAGGVQDHPGNNFGMFSDYYSYLNMQYLKGLTVWMPDASNSVDGGFAGDGYYKQWNSTANQWDIYTTDTYTSQFKGYWGPNVIDIPTQHDVPVYWLTYDAFTKAGGGISPGADYAPGLEVFPVRTIGNLYAPFRDIVTGAGRDADSNTLDGDYVMRVTYATANGLVTDNLIVPSNFGAGTSLNVPDKGELVRVDVVEAENASLAAFYRNKIVASYVNSESLANTVFGGDGTFTGASQLTLPAYWHGSKVLWSATTAGLVDFATGRVDGTKIVDGSAIRAQWTENGVLQTRTFAITLPETVEVTLGLFGKSYSEAFLPGYRVTGGMSVTLASTIAGGTVSWASSDPSVISNAGVPLSNGQARLTARVTFGNGAVRTYSADYIAQTTGDFVRSNPYVMNQLFGRPFTENAPKDSVFINADQTLPATVEQGTVTWKSSAPTVVTDAGRVVGIGTAKLSAIVTFNTGETRVFSRTYYAVAERTLKMSTAYVTNQLFGIPSDQATVPGSRLVNANLTLPTTVEGGTVAWTSSDTSIISNAGVLNANGFATMTARVTFDDGTQATVSMTYYSAKTLATGGLQWRVVDLTNFRYTNTATGIYHYISPEVLATTPIYSGTALPNWTKPVGAYQNVVVPDALRDANRNVKESLWTYSGYFVPKTTGTHVFQFSADDEGLLAVGTGADSKTVVSNLSNSQTLSIDLVAGRLTPIWAFMKTGTPGDYWADTIQVMVKNPGDTSFAAIPSNQLSPLPDALVPPTAGYPATYLPRSTEANPFDTGLGLQLRVVDLTNFQSKTTASGIDRYISPEVLARCSD
ncbi:MAG: GLEYA domain-containing protein, partial [Ilumatobacteraceae bacterium]